VNEWGILMCKWEGVGFSRASVLKTIILFVIAITIISYLFRYLVKSNKIKPGKISRIFYMDDEQYVKSWKKERNKGKTRSVFYTDVIISITTWGTSIVVIALTDGDFSRLKNTLPVFYGLLIGNTIGNLLSWNKNEEKYKELTKNME
jgi:lipoprotein signal peptidase